MIPFCCFQWFIYLFVRQGYEEGETELFHVPTRGPKPLLCLHVCVFPRVILRLFHWVHFLSHFSPSCIRTCRYHSWSRDCILQLPNTAFISFIFLLLRYIKMPIVCIRSSFSWLIKSSALSLFSFSGGKFSCSL